MVIFQSFLYVYQRVRVDAHCLFRFCIDARTDTCVQKHHKFFFKFPGTNKMNKGWYTIEGTLFHTSKGLETFFHILYRLVSTCKRAKAHSTGKFHGKWHSLRIKRGSLLSSQIEIEWIGQTYPHSFQVRPQHHTILRNYNSPTWILIYPNIVYYNRWFLHPQLI